MLYHCPKCLRWIRQCECKKKALAAAGVKAKEVGK
jgi:hypothetical protein